MLAMSFARMGRLPTRCFTLAFLLFSACYRTPLLPLACDLEVVPAALNFGGVLPGDSQTLSIAMTNHGEGLCHLRNAAVGSQSDAGFILGGGMPATVGPGATVALSVAFQPATASIPLNRKGELAFDVDSVRFGHVAIPLVATVISDCRLDVTPPSLDFGHVAIDTSVVRQARAVNNGKTDCEIGSIAIKPDSDSQFHLGSTAGLVTLAPGQDVSISVSFDARDATRPHHRTSTLAFVTNDAARMDVAVPLSADIDVGCDLSWDPVSIDFGNVTLNKTINKQVTLSNLGSATCQVSNVAIAPDSASSFYLTSASFSLAVSVGVTASIGVTFFANGSLPHSKTGALVFQTGNTRNPSARVALTGHVNTPCEEASRWVYTFDEENGFARFDPTTLTFTEIATLKCAAGGTPFSMAVDQNAVAWVHYNDGSLFKVDAATGTCEATGFKPGQHGITRFGMGFVFDPSTGEDHLFIAGYGLHNTGAQSELAIVSFPDLIVTPIGVISTGNAELTGTGDGQLWGFSPQGEDGSSFATLMRLDPASGATIESYTYPSVSTHGGWSIKFWGGNFWIFLGTSVYKVARDTPKVIHTAIAQTGRPQIVGAGVSTCAPL
jgi:hypothetical protein